MPDLYISTLHYRLLVLYILYWQRARQMAIKSFKSKALERFFLTGNARGLPADQVKRIAARLVALDRAVTPDDMNLPGYKFHGLIGDMAGRYAVSVTGNWRITFGWEGESAAAIDVDHEDYH